MALWKARSEAKGPPSAGHEDPQLPVRMAGNPRKSRPNKIAVHFSDAMPHDVLRANRTKGRWMVIGSLSARPDTRLTMHDRRSDYRTHVRSLRQFPAR